MPDLNPGNSPLFYPGLRGRAVLGLTLVGPRPAPDRGKTTLRLALPLFAGDVQRNVKNRSSYTRCQPLPGLDTCGRNWSKCPDWHEPCAPASRAHGKGNAKGPYGEVRRFCKVMCEIRKVMIWKNCVSNFSLLSLGVAGYPAEGVA